MLKEPEKHSLGQASEKFQNNFLGKAGQAISLGTNIAVGMGLFTFLGYYVDKKMDSGFLWTLFGMGLGLVYGAYEIWKVIRLLNSADSSNKEDRSKGDNGK